MSRPTPKIVDARHTGWVRLCHWIVAGSFLTLGFSGFVILMCHPRLYWGEVGNDLTPALIELPISRNYQHGGWNKNEPLSEDSDSPISASRTYAIFNQNGWARSLHFLAAWIFVLPGAFYLLAGLFTGHFRRNVIPRAKEFSLLSLWQDLIAHLRFRVPAATGGPQYGLLQKCTYIVVVFFALPLMALTGLAMSPAITAAFPILLALFGGFQSARTIHFFITVALVLFLVVHVVMVMKSGFKRQMRAMIIGD